MWQIINLHGDVQKKLMFLIEGGGRVIFYSVEETLVYAEIWWIDSGKYDDQKTWFSFTKILCISNISLQEIVWAHYTTPSFNQVAVQNLCRDSEFQLKVLLQSKAFGSFYWGLRGKGRGGGVKVIGTIKGGGLPKKLFCRMGEAKCPNLWTAPYAKLTSSWAFTGV